MFCGFGAHLENPNKFEKLAKEDWNYYKVMMKKTGLYDKIQILNGLISRKINLPNIYQKKVVDYCNADKKNNTSFQSNVEE